MAMEAPPIPVDVRILMRNQSPTTRAAILIGHAPEPLIGHAPEPLPLTQLLVDMTECTEHLPVVVASGGALYQRDGGTELMAVLSAGPLHAVYNEATDHLTWFLGADLQAHPVRRRRRGELPAALTGPWLLQWLQAKLDVDSEAALRSWLVSRLAVVIPGFVLFSSLKNIKPCPNRLRSVCEQLVSASEISRLEMQAIPCRMHHPGTIVYSTAPFCTPELLCSTQPGASLVVYDLVRKRWEKATLVQHHNGGVRIQWLYGGKSHLVMHIPYDQSGRVSLLSPDEAREAFRSGGRDFAAPHRVTLPPIRILFESETVDRLVVYSDQLAHIAPLISKDDAFLVALTCRGLHASLRKLFPQGFTTPVAISHKERLQWAMSIEPRVRNFVFYAAGASDNLDSLRMARRLGLPISRQGTEGHTTGHMTTIPWDQEYVPQAHLASLSALVWGGHQVDPIIGAEHEYKYQYEPQYNFLHIAARNKKFRVLDWASSMGYEFDSEVLRMARRGGCSRTLDLVRSKLSAHQREASLVKTRADFMRAAREGDLNTIQSHSFTLSILPDQISVPLAALKARQGHVVTAMAQGFGDGNDLTKGLAAAAAGMGDERLLQQAIDSQWELEGALTMSAKCGNMTMVEKLLPLLHLHLAPEPLASVHAAEQGHADILARLKDTPHYAPNEQLIIAAIRGGHLELRNTLAEMYAPEPDELVAAAHFGLTEFIKTHLGELVTTDDFQAVQTAAASAGCLDIIELLSSKPPSPATWEMAAAHGHLHILKALRKAGYSPDGSGQARLLSAAARINDRETLKWADELGWRSSRVASIISLYGYERHPPKLSLSSVSPPLGDADGLMI
jgi:hypothetical protein